MTEEIGALMFDAGGTIIHVEPSKEDTFARILSEHGFDAEPGRVAESMAKADRLLDEKFAGLDGVNEDRFWREYDDLVLSDLGFGTGSEEVTRETSKEFRDVMAEVENWVAYPDVVPAIERLRSRDFKLGVVSNATELLSRVLNNLDLTRFFDFVVISDEVGARKPSSRIFSVAARRAGVGPNRSIYLGDKLAVDVLGAKRAGMNAILVDRAGSYPDAPCLRIKDLTYLERFI